MKEVIFPLLAAWAEDLGAPEPLEVVVAVLERYRHLPVSPENTRSLIDDLRTRARFAAAGGQDL